MEVFHRPHHSQQVALLESLLHLTQLIQHSVRHLTTAVTWEGQRMSQQMDALVAEVAANRTVVQSAITLIQGLAQQIVDAGTDPARLQQIVDDLHESDRQLGEAVAANTPPNAGV